MAFLLDQWVDYIQKNGKTESLHGPLNIKNQFYLRKVIETIHNTNFISFGSLHDQGLSSMEFLKAIERCLLFRIREFNFNYRVWIERSFPVQHDFFLERLDLARIRFYGDHYEKLIATLEDAGAILEVAESPRFKYDIVLGTHDILGFEDLRTVKRLLDG